MPSPTSPLKKSTHLVRLNRFIAQCGICSRRAADQLILDGKVRINGHLVKELGRSVNPQKDSVKVGQKLIRSQATTATFLFNKPPRVMTTLEDPEGRPTVAHYFERVPERLFPVGRLDWHSEGLLLMTNDGDLAQKVLHPKFEIPKTYLAKVSGRPSEKDLDKLRRGVTIPGGKAKADRVEIIENRDRGQYTWIKIVISEGRNRQIRRMLEKLELDVLKLQRVAIGGLRIGQLKKGEFRELTPTDIKKIFKFGAGSTLEPGLTL